ncbi:BMP-binding endothelial regulator protein-like [Saccoglossus kowalevskii]|uniref:von Willebrand factor-like n=1 Tax=Saccoglossus kowalevskii TaxID=10224 RepID=A0ABM0GXE8_SACKO|nr:PREDICTED: von Willebrand factor-like [Saccoglossus kowalevskii]
MKAHYHTFDGVRYSFKGICTYLLMKENVTDPRFHVWANHASVTENGRTSVMVKSVDVDVNGVAIELQQGNGKLMVNGADIRPELENNGHYEIDGIEFSFVKNQNRIRVSVTGTFQVDWNGKGHIIIELDKSMIGNEKEGGKVIGLLGNANGVREDELIEQLYDGTYRVMSKLEAGEKPTMEEMIRFGISWIKDCQEVV